MQEERGDEAETQQPQGERAGQEVTAQVTTTAAIATTATIAVTIEVVRIRCARDCCA